MSAAGRPTLAEALEGQRVGLCLSAGFFGFYAHAGFCAALAERGVRPAAYSGSSAGALIAAFAAAGLPPDEVLQILAGLRRKDFWDPVGLGDLGRALPALGLLRGERFHGLLRRLLPVATFEGCPTPLFVEATNLSVGRTQTFHEGDLPRAVWASCAYPGLFLPVEIAGDHFWDGGLVNKIPLAPLVQAGVDALLLHWLPSHGLRRPLRRRAGLLSQFGTLLRGMAIARRENSQLQARLALAGGIPIYLVSPQCVRVSPGQLQRGTEAADQARRWAEQTLDAPAQQVTLAPAAPLP